MKLSRILGLNREKWRVLAICGAIFVVVIAAAIVLNIKASAARETEVVLFNRYQADSELLKSKNQAYLLKVMKGQFTIDQLEAITRKYITYSMNVDGNRVKKDDSIYYAPNKQVIVILSERCNQAGNDLIPSELVAESLRLNKSNINQALKISTNAEYSLNFVNVDGGIDVYASFSNLKAGDIVTLQFTQGFAKMLGLNQNIYEIIYNKTGN